MNKKPGLVRIDLTPEQSALLDSSKSPGEACMVVGYAQRRLWPHHDKFTLVACFGDHEDARKIFEGIGLIDRRPGRRRRRVKL